MLDVCRISIQIVGEKTFLSTYFWQIFRIFSDAEFVQIFIRQLLKCFLFIALFATAVLHYFAVILLSTVMTILSCQSKSCIVFKLQHWPIS